MTAQGTLVVISRQKIQIMAKKIWSLKISLTWYRRFLSQSQVTEYIFSTLYLQTHSTLTRFELKDQIGRKGKYLPIQPTVKMFSSEWFYISVHAPTFSMIVNSMYIYYFECYMLIFHLPVLEKVQCKSLVCVR